MSDELRVACPHCGSRFRLKSRQSLGKKVTCCHCGDKFAAREAEDDEDSAAAYLPPAPARRSPGSARRKKAGRVRVNRWVVVAAAFVVVAGLGIVFSGPLSRLFGQIGGIGNNFNLLADSPEKVIIDLRTLRREIGSTVRSVHDEGSRDSAVRKFNGLRTTAADLVVRASRLDSLTEQEIRALLEPLTKEVAKEFFDQVHAGDGQTAVIRLDATLATHEFKHAFAEIEGIYSCAVDSLRKGLKSLPEPHSEGERVECDAAEQYRRIVRLLARISSAGDRDAAASEVAGAAATMKDLAHCATEVPPGEVPRLDQRNFQDPLHQASMQCDILMYALENRYGKHSRLEQAIGQFKNERANLEMAFSKTRGAAFEQAAHDKAEKEHAAFRRSAGLDGQPATAPGGLTAGTPGGFGSLSSSPQAMRDDFLKRHGPDGVLTVTAMKYPGDKLSELSRQLREVTGANQIFALTEIDKTSVYVAYVGDVNEIAGRIDFCKVTAVDAKKRTITIEPRSSASRAKK